MNSSSPQQLSSRRRSERVKPSHAVRSEEGDLSQASISNVKRKRIDARGAQYDTEAEPTSAESSDEDDEDAAEDEWQGSRPKTPKAKSTPVKKPVAKKPKITSGGMKSLPVRAAVNGTNSASKKTKPPQRKRSKADEEVGADMDLFAKVQSGMHPDQLASDWISHYSEEATAAMRDLINFVLKCAGCTFEVDIHDIEDPDNAPSKLEDLQEQYHAQKISDYPLIAKGKGTAALRAHIVDFIQALLATASAANVLHEDPAVMENVTVWLTCMTDSTLRPFRHTATIVALAMGSTLCALAAEHGKTIATFMKQKATESKNKKKVNQARIDAIEAKIQENEERREEIQTLIVDSIFDTVFAHRYRDVESRIRLECASALAGWITLLPEVFFTGHYIRYYGWLLSDSSAPIRAEVLKQLSRLYKLDNAIGNLRAFTDRFRPRLVEIAEQDAETHIRAASINLLGQLRDLGLLEPDDIDKIGRLIFDSDPRVRHAVTPFIQQNVDDLAEAAVAELGGEETLEEALGEETDAYLEQPRRVWLVYKCLAETLKAYDPEDGTTSRNPNNNKNVTVKDSESRYSVAAKAVVGCAEGPNDFEILSGYLLYDLSGQEESLAGNEMTFKERCQLDEKENLQLLEILHALIASRLDKPGSTTDKKGKRGKDTRIDEPEEIQGQIALHLSKVIPKLLQKYTSDPACTAAILRLGQILNLEVFHRMRQDSAVYAALLDDINRQFIKHTDQSVLAEASSTLLHARNFEDLEEITDEKIEELWTSAIGTLRECTGSGQRDSPALLDAMRRVYNLASSVDCTRVFEGESGTSTKRKQDQAHNDSITDFLRNLISELGRESWSSGNDAETGDLIGGLAMKCLLLYYMWTMRNHHISPNNLTATPQFPTSFAKSLLIVLRNRGPATCSTCFDAAETYLDLYTLYATGHTKQGKSSSSSQVELIPSQAHALIFHVLNSHIKYFARKSNRKLEPDRESDPRFQDDEDHAPISDDEDEDDLEDEQIAENKAAALLLTEKKLCKLVGAAVLACVAKALDYEGEGKGKIKDLFRRNKSNLGPNFKEVVAYLDAPSKGKTQTKSKAKKAPIREQPETVELDEDPIEDEEVEVEDIDDQVEETDADADNRDDGMAALTGAQEDDIMGD